ncbi:MAG: hypothetical protein NZ891_03185 [bacterium]|nr:hypothetical protein [bacterium]MDW8163729.1 hypothetical protein [Candidatus Omnitrophota bacterium]
MKKNRILDKIFSWLRVLYYPVIFFVFFFMLGVQNWAENQVVNPFKELVEWTYNQNIGITCFYDIDGKDYCIGAKWQFFESKHQWLFSGLFATEKPSLGFHFGFNLGKLVEKIKGQPMIYLKHLEVGYSILWNIDTGKRQDGLYLNVIKIEF